MALRLVSHSRRPLVERGDTIPPQSTIDAMGSLPPVVVSPPNLPSLENGRILEMRCCPVAFPFEVHGLAVGVQCARRAAIPANVALT